MLRAHGNNEMVTHNHMLHLIVSKPMSAHIIPADTQFPFRMRAAAVMVLKIIHLDD